MEKTIKMRATRLLMLVPVASTIIAFSSIKARSDNAGAGIAGTAGIAGMAGTESKAGIIDSKDSAIKKDLKEDSTSYVRDKMSNGGQAFKEPESARKKAYGNVVLTDKNTNLLELIIKGELLETKVTCGFYGDPSIAKIPEAQIKGKLIGKPLDLESEGVKVTDVFFVGPPSKVRPDRMQRVFYYDITLERKEKEAFDTLNEEVKKAAAVESNTEKFWEVDLKSIIKSIDSINLTCKEVGDLSIKAENLALRQEAAIRSEFEKTGSKIDEKSKAFDAGKIKPDELSGEVKAVRSDLLKMEKLYILIQGGENYTKNSKEQRYLDAAIANARLQKDSIESKSEAFMKESKAAKEARGDTTELWLAVSSAEKEPSDGNCERVTDLMKRIEGRVKKEDYKKEQESILDSQGTNWYQVNDRVKKILSSNTLLNAMEEYKTLYEKLKANPTDEETFKQFEEKYNELHKKGEPRTELTTIGDRFYKTSIVPTGFDWAQKSKGIDVEDAHSDITKMRKDIEKAKVKEIKKASTDLETAEKLQKKVEEQKKKEEEKAAKDRIKAAEKETGKKADTEWRKQQEEAYAKGMAEAKAEKEAAKLKKEEEKKAAEKIIKFESPVVVATAPVVVGTKPAEMKMKDELSSKSKDFEKLAAKVPEAKKVSDWLNALTKKDDRELALNVITAFNAAWESNSDLKGVYNEFYVRGIFNSMEKNNVPKPPKVAQQ